MSGLPLYQELYNTLYAQIVSGAYSEVKTIPSERELCAMYHVSRSTVRRALDTLRKNGYISTLQGSGNFVRPQMYLQPLSKFHSFAGSLKADHVEITNRILDYALIGSDAYLQSVLPTQQDGKWHKLTRLRMASGAPLMIETSYLPQRRFYHLDIDYLSTNSLYAYLEAYYCMRINDANELLSPIMPTNEERRELLISPRVPCMLLERFCYENGGLIAIHKTIVRGDKYKFRAVYYANEV